jgi:hypothetical protein
MLIASAPHLPRRSLSEILGAKARLLRDPRHHLRPYLVVVIERECVVVPPVAFENLMGAAALALDSPADSMERGQKALGLSWRARRSCSEEPSKLGPL